MTEKDILGRRYMVTKAGHPWRGHVGLAVRIDKTLVGFGLVLKLDNGNETMVFSGSDVEAA